MICLKKISFIGLITLCYAECTKAYFECSHYKTISYCICWSWLWTLDNDVMTTTDWVTSWKDYVQDHWVSAANCHTAAVVLQVSASLHFVSSQSALDASCFPVVLPSIRPVSEFCSRSDNFKKQCSLSLSTPASSPSNLLPWFSCERSTVVAFLCFFLSKTEIILQHSLIDCFLHHDGHETHSIHKFLTNCQSKRIKPNKY